MFSIFLSAMALKFHPIASGVEYSSRILIRDVDTGQVVGQLSASEYKHVIRNREYVRRIMIAEKDALRRIRALLEDEGDYE